MDHDTFADGDLDGNRHDFFNADAVSPADTEQNAHRDTNIDPHAFYNTEWSTYTNTFYHGNRYLDTNTSCLFATHCVPYYDGINNSVSIGIGYSISWFHAIGDG